REQAAKAAAKIAAVNTKTVFFIQTSTLLWCQTPMVPERSGMVSERSRMDLECSGMVRDGPLPVRDGPLPVGKGF
ncbi:MAG: hypothetical protein LBC60_00730, partial [Spirochaetaceae bacterium]|nr:hypothetical protein [Spirochaetaceae bacterium]